VLVDGQAPRGDQQVLQDEELAHLSAFARTGDPTADGTLIWPQFRDPAGMGRILSLNAGGSSQVASGPELRRVHHCDFWDSLTPPGGRVGD